MGENIFENPCSVSGPRVSFCSASAKNFHFGASLIGWSHKFVDHQKTAWFESDFYVSSTSYIPTLLTMDLFVHERLLTP